jgi:hypothetical protein
VDLSIENPADRIRWNQKLNIWLPAFVAKKLFISVLFCAITVSRKLSRRLSMRTMYCYVVNLLRVARLYMEDEVADVDSVHVSLGLEQVEGELVTNGCGAS